MPFFEQLVTSVSNFLWGPPAIIALLGTGLLLSIRTRFIQFRKIPLAMSILRGKYDDPGIQGDVSHFQALSTALAATVGTGNVVGVATAIAVGGPGAVFWMWVTALVGMATKYSSCLLALRYRNLDAQGRASGGPMVTLEKGLGYKKLGQVFALCTVASAFGIGNLVQSHSAADYLYTSFFIPKWFSGIGLGLLTALVIIGGIKRIAHVTSRLVPLMCLFYVGTCLVILGLQIDKIPAAFGLILQYAFTPLGAAGGFVGSTVLLTMRMGVARGIFSNESGLGSAPIAHAAAKTKEPVREGLVAMLGPLIDTLIICTMTALVIITTGAWQSGLDGAALSAGAFSKGLFGWGDKLVAIALTLFAFSTILGWFYYGDRALNYLSRRRVFSPVAKAHPEAQMAEGSHKISNLYAWLWTLLVPLGALTQLRLVWNLADIANGFMAIPNLISLVCLSGVVAKATDEYFKRVKKTTPLVGAHERVNARLMDFHGWYLPVQFSGIIEEHRAVRERAGLFDTSHLGKVSVTGTDAYSFVQRIVTGDIGRLARGKILYTLVVNKQGGILDDILVYCRSRMNYLLVINAAHHDELMQWFKRHRFSQCRINDETQKYALIAVQGPLAVEALGPFLKPSYRSLQKYTFEENRFDGRADLLVSRTGYTGEDGFELFPPAAHAAWIWNRILEENKKIKILPAGLGARDTLRLEAGNLLSGQDFNQTVTPFDVGLGRTVHFQKSHFIGKSALARVKEKGADKRIAAFTMTGRMIPRTGSPIFKDNKRIGQVTSGTFSPTLKIAIGLGLVEAASTEQGNEVRIEVRGKTYPAQIVKRPFTKHKKSQTA